MPLQATSGAASYDAFGGGVAAVPNYIEDVFNTYVWTGTGSNQTLTTNVDTSTYGGLFWTKNRTNAYDHALWSTNFSLSGNYLLKSNTTGALTYGTYNTGDYVSNSTTGVTVYGNSSQNYVTWTFRKQPKFFDVVTWSGTGMSVAHSLGTTPATIILKRTNAVDDWYVVHRSANGFFSLNTTNAASGTSNAGIGTDTNTAWVAATSTTCNFENFGNAAGTYVAYLFAHNAGGFGLTGTDNVISCGSYTGNGSANGPTVTLGYEPQWLLVKSASTGGAGYNWVMIDNMRGFPVGSNDALLRANLSDAEVTSVDVASPTATGFNITTSDGGVNGSGQTYIYIAIRRGPMKVPTSGTSVYNAISRTGTGATANVTGVGFPPDMLLDTMRSTGWNRSMWDRLRGANKGLQTNNTNAEASYTDAVMSYNQDGVTLGADGNFDVNASGYTYINWFFRRAPSFFDEVCYTGTGSATTQAHNLGAVPELMILKPRSNGSNGWCVYSAAVGNTGRLLLDTSDAAITGYSVFWNSTTPTSSVFSLGTAALTNESATTFVAYLFATCAGVSKVGSYTGTGTTKQVDCGFTGGARFVLIKKTSGTGSWYVWDSARGIVSGNDPYLLLNSTAAEVTSTDYIDTYSAGFEISSTAPSEINENGGSFIFLAIS